ncbi:MAG: DEAD/DEAH box helicase [Oligoflexales bacterium]|nr:DEAD/DEAH box helicase [Oligoflexales bacterium]
MASKDKKKRGQTKSKFFKPTLRKKEYDSEQSIQIKIDEKTRLASATAIKNWLKSSQIAKENATENEENLLELSLDPWQQEATDVLFERKNLIVDAPTTAGKTRVVEYYLAQHIKDPGFRACYTCPVKSLTNDKVKEFRAMFGKDFVGISTGDTKENLGAPLVIATLESYRNSLIGVDPDLGRNLVIFDEYHYIMDSSRGSAWEEAIILSPDHCQLMLLSASVGNPEAFVQWLQKIKQRPCQLIQVKKRPVPLVNLLAYEEDWIVESDIPTKELRAIQAQRQTLAMPYPQAARIVASLEGHKLSPTLVYAAQRKQCEEFCEELIKHLEPLPPEKQQLLSEHLTQLDREFQCLSFITPELKNMITVYGICYHHSGLAAGARVSLEFFIKKGLLKYCVATMGLSLGINFAVRSTVITDFVRPSEFGRVPYSNSEILQMTGRAGRRGHDVVGFSCWLSPSYLAKMGHAKRENCHSQLKYDPTTFLGLLSRHMTLDDIEQLYNSSLRKFLQSDVDLSLITRKRVEKKLQSKELPCISPAGAAFTSIRKTRLRRVAHLSTQQETPCDKCKFLKPCHELINAKLQGSFTQLHFHLNKIGAIDLNDQLTEFGNIARFFPQNGGLLIARLIYNRQIHADNLGQAIQLMAALTFPRFKEIFNNQPYQFPWNSSFIESQIELLYPQDLFPELYDDHQGRKRVAVIREFNPTAGYIVKLWNEGLSWSELMLTFDQKHFSEGDVMNIFYRIATYLQSLASIHLGSISDNARLLRDHLLRDQLSINI